MQKAEFIKEWQRVVIKIGTNSIMNDYKSIDLRKMDRLAYVCTALIQSGIEVVLVSSGSIGVGARVLNLDSYPSQVSELQAVAAVGQVRLMEHYNRFFQYYGQHIAQVLLTRDIIDNDNSHRNVVGTLNHLLRRGIVPIINENDVVSDDEINHLTKFGDNDTLSSIVAQIIDADLLLLLSDASALYDSNPKTNDQAKPIPFVSEISPTIEAMADGKGSAFAKGGMATKLTAAKRMLAINKSMIIASSQNPDDIFDILQGQSIGTLFSQSNLRN